MNIKTKRKLKAFTLIEYIIYFTMVALFMTASIEFIMNIMNLRVKSQVQQEMNYNMRFVANRIDYEIRNATAVQSVSASQLCLRHSADATHDPTLIDLSGGQIRVRVGGATNCSTPTSTYTLTNNNLVASGLTFTNLTQAGNATINIQYSFTLTSSGQRSEWDKTQTYTSSSELRSHP